MSKENKYDDEAFFKSYSEMPRSVEGLQAAGEWHELKKLLPDFAGKRVLDLGCGFGWHCRYAAEQGATSVVGLDISQKMLEEAKKKTPQANISYVRMALEDIDFPADSFDIVLSSLALHYVESFPLVVAGVKRCLTKGGDFVFSVEHPIFTAEGKQDWEYAADGEILHWPVDRYFTEGRREAVFLGEKVTKYHKTLTTYVNALLQDGFELLSLVEPRPEEGLLNVVPGMREELRRPMMLLVAARKK